MSYVTLRYRREKALLKVIYINVLAGHLLKSCVRPLLVSKDYRARYCYPLPPSYSHSHWDTTIHTPVRHSYSHTPDTLQHTLRWDTPTHTPVETLTHTQSVRHNCITNILSLYLSYWICWLSASEVKMEPDKYILLFLTFRWAITVCCIELQL
jgi:hypothetical protein